MYRKQNDALRSWFNRKNRKPLIIRGARQVGKSTLVELFADRERLGLLNVNLERHPELAPAFETNDPGAIIQEIEFLENMQNLGPDTLLFLDEIQAIPNAIPALRYFYEERKDVALIAAGSLLEFTLADHNFSMPVGRVQYLHMGPMTFTEFLTAVGEEKLSAFILNYTWGQKIGEVVHKRLLKLLRNYYFVGGMPEAVAVYADMKNYQEVQYVHRSIIETYQDDFPKYAKIKRLNRMLHIFNYTARNVGKKVKYATISPHEQSSQTKRDLNLLCQARILNKVTHSSCSGVPLQADMNEKIFKLLFLDIGLMNSLCGLNWKSLASQEEKLINNGAVAEQFIGQHLQEALNGKPNNILNYWLREGKSSNAELDYVVEMNGQIVPIEVKSGATGKLRSMHQFMGEKKTKRGFRFDSSLPSKVKVETKISTKKGEKNVSYDLISLPLYLIEALENIVSEFP